MSHKLNDITLYYYPSGELANKFTKRQNLVSGLYVNNLNKYKPKKTSRISVTLKDKDHITGYFGSILTVNAKFDIEEYWSKSEIEQNMLILDTIHRIAILCAKEFNWEIEVFEEAYKKVIDSNFIFRQELKRKLSKDKKYYASISIEKDIEKTSIYSNFYNRSGELVNKVRLLDTYQHEMFYGGIIKNNKWFSALEFGLYTKGAELIIKASIDENEAKIIIDPKINSQEEIEGYLRRMTYTEINSQEDLINYMNR